MKRKKRELAFTMLEAVIGALALLSLLIASIDGYSAFRIIALLHDAGLESASAYANADQNLSGAAKESYAAQEGYTLLQKTIPPTKTNCSTENWCSSITLTPLPLGSINPDEIEVSVQYQVPLMILGSAPLQLSRTVSKHLESYYINNNTAPFKNSNLCGSFGGSCVW